MLEKEKSQLYLLDMSTRSVDEPREGKPYHKQQELTYQTKLCLGSAAEVPAAQRTLIKNSIRISKWQCCHAFRASAACNYLLTKNKDPAETCLFSSLFTATT